MKPPRLTRSAKLGRRTVLRGAGISVALPLLDAMVTDRGLLHGPARAAPPVRLLTFFWPNGPLGRAWAPKAPALDAAALSPCLQAFAPEAGKPDVIPYLNVVGGLAGDATWKSGHSCAMMSCGYGTADDHNNYGNWPTAATIDQIVADRHAAATPRAPSLVLAVNRAFRDEPGWTSISWRDGGKMITPERDPKAVFARLFSGAAGPADDLAVKKALQRRQSVLDFVRDDSRRLLDRLGVGDRARVQNHLEAIRAYEIQYLKPPAPVMCSGVSAPTGGVDEAMLKLIVMAFKCDITRVASFVLDVASGGRSYPDSPGGGDHALSHTADSAAKITRTNVKLRFLANALREMAAHQEAGGTLLDHALVYSNSDVRDGQAHGRDPDPRTGFVGMPVVLAGRAGGVLKGGRFINYGSRRPLTDLLCSLLNYAGVPITKYGPNGTGPLTDL